MARMHTRRRGQSGSDKPYNDEPPQWSDVDPSTIEARIVELSNQGYAPSEIGIKLRDEGIQGIPVPNVKLATGQTITDILEENDAAPKIPEDLRNVMERAVRIREHIQNHPQDASNKRALQNAESKARRLISYYRGDKLSEDFSYSYESAIEVLENPSKATLDFENGEVASTDPVNGPTTKDQIPTEVCQSMRSLPVTNTDGQLVKGPIPTDSQKFTYERFTTDDSSLYWPSKLSINSFISNILSLETVSDATDCELILIPSDHPSHEPLEISFSSVRNKANLEERCQFLAIITNKYDITWEKGPSLPNGYEAEIAVLLKDKNVNLNQVLPRLFIDRVPIPKSTESLADLITTLHQTDRDDLLTNS